MQPSTVTNIYRGAKVGRAYDAALGPPLGSKRTPSYADEEKLEEEMEARIYKNTKKQRMQSLVVLPLNTLPCAEVRKVETSAPTTQPSILLLPAIASAATAVTTQTSQPKPPKSPRRSLPWVLFEPKKSADVCGQDTARVKVQAWIKLKTSPVKYKLPLLAAACVLQGPPGCGKTTLARCCAREAGFNVIEYGTHIEQDLPSFLRSIGAIDCEGKKTCLLIEDVTDVLEAKQNSTAATMIVNYPVLCTAAFVLKRNHSQYSAVVSLSALRKIDMQKFLVNTIAPALRLLPSSFAAIIEQSRGDARQLCVNSVFSPHLHPEITSRDQTPSLYDRVRSYLACGSARSTSALLALDEPTHQECCLIQENFGALEEVTIEAMAQHSQIVSIVDVFETICAPTLGLSARASCVLRPHSSRGYIAIKESSWWNWNRRKELAAASLRDHKYRQYDSAHEHIPGHWNTRAFALHQFNAAVS
uniref:ATPase AAA-type core domain-containing protein n=1 Tax=viral metagenome TaxID=1070528 RepID=A0A6C0C0G4_9ZZZZ